MKLVRLVFIMLLLALPSFGASTFPTPGGTFANLPANGASIRLYTVEDCIDTTCAAGSGSIRVLKIWNGSAWENQAAAGGGTLSTSSAGLDVADHVIDLDVTPGSGSATLEQSDDALQVKYDTGDFTEGANGLVLATNPSMGGANVSNIDAANITTGEIPAAVVGADHIGSLTDIATGLKSGSDATLVTGTSGATDDCAKWDAGGDLVSAGAACGSGGGGDNVQINGVEATDPDFRSDGVIDVIRCTGAGSPDASCVAAEDVIYRYNDNSVGADAIDNNIEFMTTGTIRGKIHMGINSGTSITLLPNSTRGNFHVNSNAAGIRITLPTAVKGLSACFYDFSTSGATTTLDVDNTSDRFVLDGVDQTLGDSIDSAGDRGDFICIIAIDATNWLTLGRSGVWLPGGT